MTSTASCTVDQLDAIDPTGAPTETYVCGPAPLMDGARRLFDAAGAADQLHTEAFTLDPGGGRGRRRRRHARASTTTGIAVANDGRPILEQAEAAGLAPQHGCRMGICHTCTRSLTCGTVRNVVDGELTTAPPRPASPSGSA